MGHRARGDDVVDDASGAARREAAAPAVRLDVSFRSILLFLLTALGLAGACWLLVQVWQIILVLVIAVVLAGTLNPVVDWLEARRLGRPIALGAILLALIAAVVGLAALIIPALVAQVRALIAGAPELQHRAADTVAGIPLLAGQADVLRALTPGSFLAPAGSLALSIAGAAAVVVALGVTTVVLAFYLLAERERSLGFVYALLPRRFHLRTARILLDMETVVGGYIRGQALTSLLIGTYVFVLLSLVGTPSPLPLAILAGFADLIPFVGGILTVVPAVLVTLPLGITKAVVVLVAIVVYQEFESRVIIPRVYGRTLRLSAVAVTVALLVGGKLLGIVGALLALPLAAGIRVLIEDLRIELPGEVTGERAERALDARAEAVYIARSEGASAEDAAAVAGTLAEELQTQQEETKGRVEIPIEERADTRS
jgi:predicted PurR-regulated permease PerM